MTWQAKASYEHHLNAEATEETGKDLEDLTLTEALPKVCNAKTPPSWAKPLEGLWKDP